MHGVFLSWGVLEAGRRQRTQPPPPAVVFDALADPSARWLTLLDDEQPPRVIEASRPDFLVWSSLWTKRPDARIRFDLSPDGAFGTSLCWTLLVASELPDPSLLGHMRKRLNELINANLRYTFGQ
jgi:hypothetical protein